LKLKSLLDLFQTKNVVDPSVLRFRSAPRQSGNAASRNLPRRFPIGEIALARSRTEKSG
jgi:hypothetical protein